MRRVITLGALALALFTAAPAAAHIDVLPLRVAKGEAQEFTVRVPTERDIPTTRVQIDFPDEITVYSFSDPPAGWTVRPVVGPDQRLRGVVYSGGRIPPGRYVDFHMLGTPFEAGDAVWTSRQTYSDGKVKPWTDPPEGSDEATAETGPTDPGPAALVTVAEPGAGPASEVTPTAAASDDSGAAIWLGVIAIAVSALALLAAGFLWSTRPARLPGGDGDA